MGNDVTKPEVMSQDKMVALLLLGTLIEPSGQGELSGCHNTLHRHRLTLREDDTVIGSDITKLIEVTSGQEVIPPLSK